MIYLHVYDLISNVLIKIVFIFFFFRQKFISDSGESDNIKVKVTSGSYK